jgi:hypothetical protein
MTFSPPRLAYSQKGAPARAKFHPIALRLTYLLLSTVLLSTVPHSRIYFVFDHPEKYDDTDARNVAPDIGARYRKRIAPVSGRWAHLHAIDF